MHISASRNSHTTRHTDRFAIRLHFALVPRANTVHTVSTYVIGSRLKIEYVLRFLHMLFEAKARLPYDDSVALMCLSDRKSIPDWKKFDGAFVVRHPDAPAKPEDIESSKIIWPRALKGKYVMAGLRAWSVSNIIDVPSSHSSIGFMETPCTVTFSKDITTQDLNEFCRKYNEGIKG